MLVFSSPICQGKERNNFKNRLLFLLDLNLASIFCQHFLTSDFDAINWFFQDWSPVIEPNHEGAIISDSMFELVKNGKFNRVPLLSGINSEEELSHIASKYFCN